MIKNTKTPDFRVDEKLNEKAHVAEIFLPKQDKPQRSTKTRKQIKRGSKLYKTGKKTSDVVMDVYMGVLSQIDQKPKIEILK